MEFKIKIHYQLNSNIQNEILTYKYICIQNMDMIYMRKTTKF